jgi:hypothetical protein
VYGAKNMNSSVYGITPDYFTVKNVKIVYGTNITEKNINNLDKVAVI